MAQPRSIPTDIRAGYNGTGSTIAANLVVIQQTSGVDGIALPGSADAIIFGVTMAAIEDGAWGDIQTSGVAVVQNTSGVTQGQRLGINTVGRAITFAASAGDNAALLGICKTTGATLELVEVELAGPAANRQG
jgi:hypothetical protein